MKCYIFVVNAKLGWLQNVDGMHMVDVSSLSIGQQGLKGQCHEIFCFKFVLEKSYLNPLNHLYRLHRLQVATGIKSTTPAVPVAKFAPGVVDTSANAIAVVNTGGAP
jgi:hypothetical protein